MKRPDRRRPAGYAALRQHDGPPPPEFPLRVDRDVYPRPDYEFPHADVGMTYASSAPDAVRSAAAPDGSPNVLIVLLDDVGYGVLSTFGGLVESPALERLAKGGLRYCRFHSTGLSSPTRAALLTGRNHHTVGAGAGQEHAGGYAGYHGAIPKSCATIAELLKQNGYATGWWGKHHNLPAADGSAAGPFDRWPTGLGADYFYGFIGDATDRFHPAVYRNTTAVDPARTSEPGYHLTTDLANDCIAWIREQKALVPDRPFFAYFAPGCAHAPHQPPLDRRGRHAAKFDFGWDEYRRRVFERQLELGVIPRDARLSDRPGQIAGWDAAGPDERRLFARLFENYADYLEHADYEVGRIVDALAEASELENTLIFYIAGDNGCSAEGGATGTLNEAYTRNGFGGAVDELVPRIASIGNPGTWPHIPNAWAWAGNTPFQETKGMASHFGATRVPLVVHWPLRVRSAGQTRFQFHHVIDVAPTILEVVGIAQPSMVNGVPQGPIEGVSMAYTFAADGAPTERRRHIQYFEAFGSRALYADGWLACCRHASPSFDDERWELYHVAVDYSQTVDLAEREPAKLRELQDLFMAEAARHNVLPLDDRLAERRDDALRPSVMHGRKRVTFVRGMARLPESVAPRTSNITHAITANVRIPRAGAEGVIVCCGGEAGGWSLYVMNKRLVYHYNFFDRERYEAVSDREVPSGDIEVKVLFTNETSTPGGPARVALFIDGEPVGGARIARQARVRFGTESLDVGIDACSPVSNAYRERRGFPFAGVIERVTLDYDSVTVPVGPREGMATLTRAGG